MPYDLLISPVVVISAVEGIRCEMENSPVLSVTSGGFSIIQLLDKIPPEPQKLSNVYSRIEAVLLKESQNINKKEKIEELFNKYKITQFKNRLP